MKKFLVSVFFALSAPSVYATVIDQSDYYLDHVNNLRWLDTSQIYIQHTPNLPNSESWAEADRIIAEELTSWRLPTVDEFCSLLFSFSISACTSSLREGERISLSEEEKLSAVSFLNATFNSVADYPSGFVGLYPGYSYIRIGTRAEDGGFLGLEFYQFVDGFGIQITPEIDDGFNIELAHREPRLSYVFLVQQITDVPEPDPLALLGLGLATFAWSRKKKVA